MLPNRESGPQNQPNANVAVSVSVGTEASVGGIVALGTGLVVARGIVFLSFVEPRKIAPKTSPIKHAPTNTILRIGVVALSRSAIGYTSIKHKFAPIAIILF
jgi:hypothetical protein